METIAVVGAGRMGEALLAGLVRSGRPARDILVVEPRAERAAELTGRYGTTTVTAAEAGQRAEVLLIAVKPQDAGKLLTQIGPTMPAGRLVVSICAGLPTTFFAERLPEGTPIVRVMPNTPALISQGMSALSAGEHATADHLRLAESLFQPLGRTVIVPEYQQDAVTAISGSGPAYFYHLVESMIDAGVLLGLPRDIARELVVQTAVGSSLMLAETGEHPVLLREAVSSPAGTTVAAVRQLEIHGMRAAVMDAAKAARDRAVELAS